MSEFKVKINAAAKIDIQDGIKWYNSKLPGLGISFHQEVKKTIDSVDKIFSSPVWRSSLCSSQKISLYDSLYRR